MSCCIVRLIPVVPGIYLAFWKSQPPPDSWHMSMRYSHEWGFTRTGRPENSSRGRVWTCPLYPNSQLPGCVKPASAADLECPLPVWPSAFVIETKTHPGLLGPPASGPVSQPRRSPILLPSFQALVPLRTSRKNGAGNLPSPRSEELAITRVWGEFHWTRKFCQSRDSVLVTPCISSNKQHQMSHMLSKNPRQPSPPAWGLISLCILMLLSLLALPPRCWIPALQPNKQKTKPKPALPSQSTSHSLPRTSKYGLPTAGGWCRNLTTATGTLHFVAQLILNRSQKFLHIDEKQGAVLPKTSRHSLASPKEAVG